MKIIKTSFLLGLCALGVWGCNNSSTTNNGSGGLTIQPLTVNQDAEKQHLFFRLTDEVQNDSSFTYVAKSIFNDDTVALKLEVTNGIKPGVTDDNTPLDVGFSEGTIKISRSGEGSDKFLAALGTMFGLQTSGQMTSETVSPTVFSSNKDEVDLSQSGTFRFKLFFENEAGEPAEVFAVLDTYKKSFELTEKDSTFRQQIISAFEAK